MTKVFKVTGIVFGLIILLCIVAVGFVMTCVSPNKFKPIIISEVNQYTKRQLVIDGDLSWSFFPYLSVKVGHAALSNPAGFKQQNFAELRGATIGVKFLPLLHGDVETNGIVLTGLSITLMKNADGKTNWQDLQAPAAATAPAATATTATSSKQNKMLLVSLNIPSVEITDAHIAWRDDQAKQSADISDFNLHAKDISFDQSFPITSSFTINSQNPDLNGKGSIDGSVKFNINKKLYNINQLNFVLNGTKAKQKLNISVTGDVTADLVNETLRIENLVSKIANMALNGKVNVTNLSSSPKANGHIQIAAFNAKEFLQSMGQDASNLQVADKVSADLNFMTTGTKAATKENPYAALQTMNANGTVKIEDLQTSKIHMANLTVVTKLTNGVLDLSPIAASLYEGTLEGNAQVNFNAANPTVSLQTKLSNIQAEPLLTDLGVAAGDKLKIKGVGNIELQVTTSGLDANNIVKNLNGTSKFSFQNGKLEGVNIGYVVETAYALLKRQTPSAANESVTNFGTLTGTAKIENGVISNNDLFVNSPRFDTTGQGTIDLVNQQINYKLQAMSKFPNQDDKNPLSVNHLAIPITVVGSLSKPVVTADMQAVVKELANVQIKQVQNKLQDKLSQKIKDKLSGDSGKELLQNLLNR